ncbi:MAG: DNA-protecting protein DprA [Alphaproteobacteria bacterium]|jgi:DNA processing protein|nr:DNA-protecting protein DprA [Alphaproteobacteria bacterium]
MAEPPKPDQPAGQALTDRQRLDWLRLTRTSSIGPRTFRSLLNRYGGAAAALEALPALLKAQGRASKVVSVTEAEDEVALASKMGVRFIAMGEPDYPPLLRMIDSAPPIIGVRGRVSILSKPSVAIVGSRNASAAGLKMAGLMAADLGKLAFVVVSGLARGIDASAHRASLSSGTVAVLAGGHDRPYPDEHRDLLDAIADTGAVVSEMPMGWEPRGRDFPRRNRIISGLSYGVVIIEAALRSGSLITARFAGEQGRDIFAVPGSPLDPRSEGTNALIREGATLITSADHIAEALAPVLGRLPFMGGAEEGKDLSLGPFWDELDPDLDDAERTTAFAEDAPDDKMEVILPRDHIFALLGTTPIPIDDLVRLSGRPVASVRTLLVELELEGRIARQDGGLITAVLPR